MNIIKQDKLQGLYLLNETTLRNLVASYRESLLPDINDHEEKEESIEQGNHFVPGEDVKVLDGPFANFVGTIESMKDQKVKVEVMNKKGRTSMYRYDGPKYIPGLI